MFYPSVCAFSGVRPCMKPSTAAVYTAPPMTFFLYTRTSTSTCSSEGQLVFFIF